MAAPLVFLLDVDNTLIENDRVKADMEQRTREFLGDDKAQRFWEIYEEVRRECDFVDFPETLERFADEFPNEPRFGDVAGRLLLRTAGRDDTHVPSVYGQCPGPSRAQPAETLFPAPRAVPFGRS